MDARTRALARHKTRVHRSDGCVITRVLRGCSSQKLYLKNYIVLFRLSLRMDVIDAVCLWAFHRRMRRRRQMRER